MTSERNPKSFRLAALRWILAAACSLANPPAGADEHAWSGNGASGRWSDAANWQGNQPPQPGEAAAVLRFPAGPARLVSTNDMIGLTISQIQFSGTNYLLGGTNALTLTATSAVSLSVGNGSNEITLPLIFLATNSVMLASNSSLVLAGQISGPGAFNLNGGGMLILAPAAGVDNNFAGTSRVLAGTLFLNSGHTNDSVFGTPYYATAVSGNLVVGQTNGTLPAVLSGMALSPKTQLTVIGSGQYEAAQDTCASLEGDGLVDFHASLNVGGDNRSTEFAGRMNGINDSGPTKVGTGTWTVAGSDIGGVQIAIEEGTLIMDGNYASSSVVIGSPLNGLKGGSLKGSGVLDQLIAYGPVSPGDDGPGRLAVGFADLDFNSILLIQLGGTNAGLDYSQLRVTSQVDIFGPNTLRVSVVPGFLGAIGNQYAIISNVGPYPVTGGFTGLPEGSAVYASNGARFRISYHGGASNDVVLTQISLPAQPQFSGIMLPGGGVELTGTGYTNATYTVWANTNLVTTNWATLGTATANGSGQIQFIDTNSASCPHRFYRFSWP